MNKLFNKIVIALVSILLLVISVIVYRVQDNKTKSTESFKLQKVTQLKANNEVEEYKMKAEILKNELHKQNELIVLEGQRTVKYVFNHTKDEITYTKGNPLGFLVNKLNELKTKEITVTGTFNYIFSYDLNNLGVEVYGDMVYINLHRADIGLKPLAEDSSKRIIETSTRILSGDFTPQQTSAVMHSVATHTYNNIVTDNTLYEASLSNTKDSIKELVNKMGIKNIVIDTFNTNTIQNEEVEVVQ